jgi:hypothetical protein
MRLLFVLMALLAQSTAAATIAIAAQVEKSPGYVWQRTYVIQDFAYCFLRVVSRLLLGLEPSDQSICVA